MKVGKVYSYDDIRVEEVEIPTISDDEALVKIADCGICTGELTPWYINKKTSKLPQGFVIGHEFAGTIVELGKKAPSKFKLGDRVFVHHHAPCMKSDCHYCSRKLYVQCPKWKELTIKPGGMAEYVRVKNHGLKNDTIILSEEMTFEQAVFIEPLACSVKAIRKAQISEGDVVVVIGLGIMGLLNAMLAKNAGATVIGADISPERLDFASVTRITEKSKVMPEALEGKGASEFDSNRLSFLRKQESISHSEQSEQISKHCHSEQSEADEVLYSSILTSPAGLSEAKSCGGNSVPIDKGDSEFAQQMSRGCIFDLLINSSTHNLAQEVLQFTNGKKADVVIVGPASLQAHQDGIKCVGAGGKLISFMSMPVGEKFPLEHSKVYFEEISLIPSYSCGPDDTQDAFELLRSGEIQIEDLITSRFPLSEFPQAFKHAAKNLSNIKTLIKIS